MIAYTGAPPYPGSSRLAIHREYYNFILNFHHPFHHPHSTSHSHCSTVTLLSAMQRLTNIHLGVIKQKWAWQVLKFSRALLLNPPFQFPGSAPGKGPSSSHPLRCSLDKERLFSLLNNLFLMALVYYISALSLYKRKRRDA